MINKKLAEKYLRYCEMISLCQKELNIKTWILKTSFHFINGLNSDIIKEREEYIHYLKIAIRLLQRGLSELVNNKAMGDYCYLNVPHKNATPEILAMAAKKMENKISHKMNKPAKK